MDSLVQMSFSASLKKLTSCVSGEKEHRPNQRSKGRGLNVRRGAPPVGQAVLRAYQSDLDRERKLRESRNAQKNAERAAMRAHFRRKYHLTPSVEDTGRVQAVGGRVSLPPDLSDLVRGEDAVRDESSALLTALKELSVGLMTDSRHSPAPTNPLTPPDRADRCSVM